MNEKFCILIWISLKFVAKGSTDNIWTGADPVHWRIYALEGDELALLVSKQK